MRSHRVHSHWHFSLDQECTFDMNLPMVSILQGLGLGVHELGSSWIKLTGRCALGTHQEGTTATNGPSVPEITLEVIQSKEHLKCIFSGPQILSTNYFTLHIFSCSPQYLPTLDVVTEQHTDLEFSEFFWR